VRKLAHCRSTRGFNHSLAGATFGISRKREGLAAKHLRAKAEKAMEINRANVAELVDAWDLNSLRLLRTKRFFAKRPPSFSPNLPEQNVICKTPGF
jgi:hypothetical protein